MIAEIAGLTGTGKSTIIQAIAQRGLGIQTDYHLKWRYILPVYYARAVLAMPMFLVRYRAKKLVFWPALRWMTYLEMLHITLSRLDHNCQVLLDQGPVYWLTYLYAFGSDGIQEKWFTRWWTRTLDAWSSILDVIYYLDCDDTILIERVRDRNKKHRLQEFSDEKAREFLGHYRIGYQYVLAKLTAIDGPRIYHLSTDLESPERIATQILSDLLTESHAKI